MKKYFLIVCLSLSSLLMSSCMDEFLNVSPNSGLTDAEVFTKQQNFKKFFDVVYSDFGDYAIATGFGLHWNYNSQKFTLESLTDMSDQGRIQTGQTFKGGTMYPSQATWGYSEAAWSNERFGWFQAMWKAIRVANTALEKVNLIQNATDAEKWDLRAQAYFVRGFCHFHMFRVYGAMPHVTKPLGPDDQWDIPQLSKYETALAVAQDMDSAIVYYQKAGKMRRDPGPGGALHLIDPDMYRPNGCAAVSLKARALLYAASPLNNDKGVVAWENAAKANWTAIQAALENQYELLSWTDYKKNFNGNKYSNEQIWGWYGGTVNSGTAHLQTLLCGIFKNDKNASGECPTQNHVDKYETIWGDPLNTQADRDAATALGHYNEQDPYANRDPRFDFNVIHNQSTLPGTWTGGKAQIWFQNSGGATTYGQILSGQIPTLLYQGVTQTGYLQRKRWGGESVFNPINVMYTEPVIRLAELYLNYAEAANEAYGPNVIPPYATLSAADAINKLRDRVGMAHVQAQLTANADVFKDRIRNERIVELCFEGSHYYYDIRRWMTAPTAYGNPLIGMVVEKLAASTTDYPTGYKYSRAPLAASRQIVWKEAMYYMPFAPNDYRLMKNFTFGPKW